MSVNVFHGDSDEIVDQIVRALGAYEAEHPRSKIDVYRHTPVSVRVRIIDPDFARRGISDRLESVHRHLRNLSEEARGDISSLTLITPREVPNSGMNHRFEDTDPTGWWDPGLAEKVKIEANKRGKSRHRRQPAENG